MQNEYKTSHKPDQTPDPTPSLSLSPPYLLRIERQRCHGIDHEQRGPRLGVYQIAGITLSEAVQHGGLIEILKLANILRQIQGGAILFLNVILIHSELFPIV